MIRFTSSSVEAIQHGVKLLVYAPSGVGKTVLTATLPTPVLISAESGLLALNAQNLSRIFGDNPKFPVTKDIPTIVIQTADDLEQAYAWCATSHEAKTFQSIAIDSITEIAEQVLAKEIAAATDKRQAYGELIVRMDKIIKNFRDLPSKHIYMSAKMDRNKDEFTGRFIYGPSMPGAKVGPSLPYLFDEVFYYGMHTGQDGVVTRALLTQPTEQYTAKDRSGALSQYEYPNLTYIFAKISGAL